ncbi:MAG: hypothetical protein BMS9Abin05_1783 [Rhodothermia bacterium]|nr:MAG: hypothetical protein BMS9Abin05_1783 [Rhodothermia bacterium]
MSDSQFRRDPFCLVTRGHDRQPNGTTTTWPWVFVATVMMAGCAVPVPPTGGPTDQDPPTLVSSIPPDGSVNQTIDRLSFQFDERLDERSASQSVSVIPDFDQPLDVRIRGDRIEVIFPGPLRSNTTYIVTLDSGLRDAHNVALTQPITVAFGTGPSINRGKLRGRVLLFANGAPAVSTDVFAFAIDSSATDQVGTTPVYRTQTDIDGYFSLTYLREGPYRVIALKDRNRNRSLDRGEKSAVPPVDVLVADSMGQAVSRAWVLATIDTERPRIQEIRALSIQELQLRFSEPVVLQDTVAVNWQLADSASAVRSNIRGMYSGADPREVILRHDPLIRTPHRLTGEAAIADSTGNAMVSDTLYFVPSSEPPDSTSSFLGFQPDSLTADAVGYFRLWPEIQPSLSFSKPPAEDWIIEVRDTTGVRVSHRSVTRNGVELILTEPDFRIPMEISLTGHDTTHSRIFVRVGNSSVGELSGIVMAEGAVSPLILQLIRDDGGAMMYSTLADSEGNFRFSGLPGQTKYLVRAFVDRNGDQKWNPGRLKPYVEPEPIAWKAVEEAVRARWDTVIPDTVSVIVE